jgi:hypothetical protein
LEATLKIPLSNLDLKGPFKKHASLHEDVQAPKGPDLQNRIEQQQTVHLERRRYRREKEFAEGSAGLEPLGKARTTEQNTC